MTLHLAQDVLDDLRALCVARYPEEACGLLLGREEPRPGKGPKRVVLVARPATNLNQERPRDRFRLDPADFVTADAEARDAGLEIIGIYHSHPDQEARPSSTDLAEAHVGWSYVIVSVQEGRPAGETSWVMTGPELLEEKICIC